MKRKDWLEWGQCRPRSMPSDLGPPLWLQGSAPVVAGVCTSGCRCLHLWLQGCAPVVVGVCTCSGRGRIMLLPTDLWWINLIYFPYSLYKYTWYFNSKYKYAQIIGRYKCGHWFDCTGWNEVLQYTLGIDKLWAYL
jgi:hypothetical protein